MTNSISKKTDKISLLTPQKCSDLNELLSFLDKKKDEVDESRNFMILSAHVNYDIALLQEQLDKLISDKYVVLTSTVAQELDIDYMDNYALTELGMNFIHYGGYVPEKPTNEGEIKKNKRSELVERSKYHKAWYFYIGIGIAVYFTIYTLLNVIFEFDFHKWLLSHLK